jgi:hypothetical protein
MKQQLAEKYGTREEIRYLISSMDDLWDVVNTVNRMIEKRCEKGDIVPLKKAISMSIIPLKNSLSAFILGFKVHSLVVGSQYAGTKRN